MLLSFRLQEKHVFELEQVAPFAEPRYVAQTAEARESGSLGIGALCFVAVVIVVVKEHTCCGPPAMAFCHCDQGF